MRGNKAVPAKIPVYYSEEYYKELEEIRQRSIKEVEQELHNNSELMKAVMDKDN